MTTQEAMLEMELAELLIAVDATRDANDTFKLPAYLLALIVARLADLRVRLNSLQTVKGTLTSSSTKLRDALDELERLLKQGYQFIDGLLDFQISAADKQGLFVTYGWERGNIGRFTDDRIETMANLAISLTPTIPNAAHRYPEPLITAITNQLAIVNANQPPSSTGPRQVAMGERDAAVKLVGDANERGRHYYCSASDLKDKTPQLARIGRQPRRDPGDAGGPLPGPVVGQVTLDAANLTLSIAELPENATTIRAYRQAAGGNAELAGTSTTTTVSLTQSGPLNPGTSYEFWVAGHNSEGEGPDSEHVQHTTAP